MYEWEQIWNVMWVFGRSGKYIISTEIPLSDSHSCQGHVVLKSINPLIFLINVCFDFVVYYEVVCFELFLMAQSHSALLIENLRSRRFTLTQRSTEELVQKSRQKSPLQPLIAHYLISSIKQLSCDNEVTRPIAVLCDIYHNVFLARNIMLYDFGHFQEFS